MRYLLDECLSAVTAKTMGVLGAPNEFTYILDIAAPSTDDPDIPALCQANRYGTLITINVKDFGARKHIYQAVIDAGINVLVLRRQKGQATTNYWQVALLARHYPRYRKLFDTATEATLASLTDSGVRSLTLSDLVAEIEADEAGRKRLP